MMKTFAIDRESLLVHVDADARLCDVENALAREGLTLDVDDVDVREETVGAWLDHGARGARSAWLDPADHLIAGFSARFRSGEGFAVKPAPRRAVGPDLLALILGTERKLLALESVWLRVHRVAVARPNIPFEDESAEPLNADERVLFAAIENELRDNRR